MHAPFAGKEPPSYSYNKDQVTTDLNIPCTEDFILLALFSKWDMIFL